MQKRSARFATNNYKLETVNLISGLFGVGYTKKEKTQLLNNLFFHTASALFTTMHRNKAVIIPLIKTVRPPKKPLYEESIVLPFVLGSLVQ